MASWFRSWHGAPTDNKWLVVANRAKVKPGIVSAVAWALMDYASQEEERGSVAGFDAETYAVFSGFEESDIEAVITAMREKGIITSDNKLSAWDKRQVREENDRPSAEVWAKIRSEVFDRDDYTCQYCGARGVKLECDHVMPVSRGGGHELENLATACFVCNRSKRAKTIEEWRS